MHHFHGLHSRLSYAVGLCRGQFSEFAEFVPLWGKYDNYGLQVPTNFGRNLKACELFNQYPSDVGHGVLKTIERNVINVLFLFVRFGLRWDDVRPCLTYTEGSLAPFVIIMQQEWYVRVSCRDFMTQFG